MITSFVNFNPSTIKFSISSLRLSFINYLTNTVTIQQISESNVSPFFDKTIVRIQNNNYDTLKITNYEQ